MKLFCAILVIYVVGLALFGVDGRGGGGTRNGAEDPVQVIFRARRHAILANDQPPNPPQQAHEPPPQSPPQIRYRRSIADLVANEQLSRQRRQLPSPPEGFPAPPEGLPAPPQWEIKGKM